MQTNASAPTDHKYTDDEFTTHVPARTVRDRKCLKTGQISDVTRYIYMYQHPQIKNIQIYPQIKNILMNKYTNSDEYTSPPKKLLGDRFSTPMPLFC